jgi:glycosyltransferase involved in cell wall biosynthesis
MPRQQTDRIHVLHLIGLFDEAKGGAQQLVLNIARHLDPNRFVTTVCYMFGEGTMSAHLPAHAHTIALNRRSNADVSLIPTLRSAVKRSGANIVHTHSPLAGTLGRVFARVGSVEAIVSTEHNVREFYKPGVRWLNALTLGRADQIVCVSGAVQDSIAQVLEKRQVPAMTIRNFVDPADLEKRKGSRDVVRAELGINMNDLVLVNVATLVHQKDQATLLRAMRLVRDAVPHARLLVVGDGPLMGELDQLRTQLGLQDAVTLTGRRKDVPALIAASDIQVVPSLHEGLSIAVLEGMALGKPFVATDIGPNKEPLGDCAVFVPTGDHEKLAQGIIDLSRRPDEMAVLGERLRARANEQFSAASRIRELAQVYETLAAAPRNRKAVA